MFVLASWPRRLCALAVLLLAASMGEARADYEKSGSATVVDSTGIEVTSQVTWDEGDDAINWVEVTVENVDNPNSKITYAVLDFEATTDPRTVKIKDNTLLYSAPGTYKVTVKFYTSEGGTEKAEADCGTVTIEDED